MSSIKDPRVLFAAERTLLAWIRTSVALVAFGFVVERSGLLIALLAPEHSSGVSKLLTFVVGAAFVVLGVLAAEVAAWQHQGVLATLSDSQLPERYRTKTAVVLSHVVAVLGLLLLVALYFGHVGGMPAASTGG